MRPSKRWEDVQLHHYASAVEGRTDPPRYKKFLSYIGSPPLNILDVGCAGGDITHDLKMRGYEVVGIDYPQVTTKTQAKYPDLRLLAWDVNEGLDFDKKWFYPDWIYASEILEHITPALMAELYDPGDGLFWYGGSLPEPGACHSVALLPDGRVLVLPGDDTADLYWP